jgi:uncharacterized protein
MRLRKRLIDILEPSWPGHTIREVRIGLGFTAVKLYDGRAGVAYTLGKEPSRGCTVFSAERHIAGGPAEEVLHYLNFERPAWN